MLIHQLSKPSLAEIRANFISEQLKSLPLNSRYINVFVTGRSASGKTTLGNKLIGENYFLSTGRQNTTQFVNLIDFPGGIRFFDLPGVDGGDEEEGDRLENYNRVSIGLKQFPEYPSITDITVATYMQGTNAKEHTLTLDQYAKLPFKPDLIFYLIDPQKGLTRSEKKYASDLIREGHKIIYVLNIRMDKSGNSFATAQNFKDVDRTIKDIHIKLRQNKAPITVNANCQNGQGISKLLEQASILLNDNRSFVFQEVILAQQQKAPQLYIDSIKHELVRLFSDLACYRPNSTEDAKEKLEDAAKVLWKYLLNFSILEKKEILISYSDISKLVKLVISVIVFEIKTDTYTPIRFPFPIPFLEVNYKYDQVHNTIFEEEEDVNQPIYNNKYEEVDEGFFHYLKTGSRTKTYYYKEFSGKFRKKTVEREVYAGTRKLFSNINFWFEPIGLQKYSHSTFSEFGIAGICFLQVLYLAIISSNFKNKRYFNWYMYSYYIYRALLGKAKFLNQSVYYESDRLTSLLKDNINIIFDKQFDWSAKAAFIEPVIFEKSRRTNFVFVLRYLLIVVIFFIDYLLIYLIDFIYTCWLVFSELIIQCFAVILCYGKFILQLLYSIYLSLGERFID